MDIIIRISPQISPTCVNWINDKQQLINTCLRSLLQIKTNQKIHFLLDNIDNDELYKIDGTVTHINKGNKRETISEMYKLADSLTDNKILFLEDDYLWRPDANLTDLEQAIDNFGCCTPYDHPDHYLHPIRKFHQLAVFNNQLYRNCVTTTHTFGVTRELFNKYRNWFDYGQHDWQMWTKLVTMGVTIWSPTVSLATHLAQGHLALTYNWQQLYQSLI